MSVDLSVTCPAGYRATAAVSAQQSEIGSGESGNIACTGSAQAVTIPVTTPNFSYTVGWTVSWWAAGEVNVGATLVGYIDNNGPVPTYFPNVGTAGTFTTS